MAFRAPIPQYYVPPTNKTLPKIVLVALIIFIVIIAIVVWILLRRAWGVSCKSNLDCTGGTKCDKTSGYCQECLQSSDCPDGQVCSTAFTCLTI